MGQELLSQRDTLAQTKQLGELEAEYAVTVRKQMIFYGAVLLILSLIILPAYHNSILYDVFVVVLLLALYGGILYYYRRVHVYVYSGGLVYMNGNKRIAVRWEEIKSVSWYRSYRGSRGNVKLIGKGSLRRANPTIVSLTPFLDKIDELYSTIQCEVQNQRTLREGEGR